MSGQLMRVSGFYIRALHSNTWMIDMKQIVWIILSIFLVPPVTAQADDHKMKGDVICFWDKLTNSYLVQPRWVCDEMYKYKINESYTSQELGTWQFFGDFDGDQTIDVAVWVKEKKSNKYGIVFFNSSVDKPIIIGAGSATDYGDNLNKFDLWAVLPRQKLISPLEKTAVTPKGDAIFLNSPDSGSAAVYWNGKTYVWFKITED
jgi:hypothetical protein